MCMYIDVCIGIERRGVGMDVGCGRAKLAPKSNGSNSHLQFFGQPLLFIKIDNGASAIGCTVVSQLFLQPS